MKKKYGGMTVNERLHVSGLMGQFDSAIKNRDATAIITILKEVELNEESINAILMSENFTGGDK